MRLRSRAGRDFSTVTFKRVSRQSNLAINAHNIDEETRELIGLFSRNFQRHRVTTPPLCRAYLTLCTLEERSGLTGLAELKASGNLFNLEVPNVRLLGEDA